jgi:hypothetical protein
MTAALRITLTGHLTRSSLSATLHAVEGNLKSDNRPLIVDCRRMTGYDADARTLFVEWNTRYRARLSAVAVVGDAAFGPLLVSAMALAARQKMKVFRDEPSALAWANGAAAANGTPG